MTAGGFEVIVHQAERIIEVRYAAVRDELSRL